MVARPPVGSGHSPRRAAALLLAALTFGLATVPAGAATVGVAIRDNQFSPATIEIVVGDTVRWTHAGNNPHSVTASDGSFDSSPMCPPMCLMSGDTFSRRFSDRGTFAYYCRLHGAPDGTGMAGVVLVRAAAASETGPPSTNSNESRARGPRVESLKLARTGPGSGLVAAAVGFVAVGLAARMIARRPRGN